MKCHWVFRFDYYFGWNCHGWMRGIWAWVWRSEQTCTLSLVISFFAFYFFLSFEKLLFFFSHFYFYSIASNSFPITGDTRTIRKNNNTVIQFSWIVQYGSEENNNFWIQKRDIVYREPILIILMTFSSHALIFCLRFVSLIEFTKRVMLEKLTVHHPR